MRIGEAGLGMWVMSKSVLLVFLFALLVLLSGFLRIYEEKIVEDTARAQVVVWTESANTAASFTSGSSSAELPTFIEVRDAKRSYTGYLKNIDDERVVFSLAWGDYALKDKIIDGPGFVTATALNLPTDVTTVHFFDGKASSLEYKRPYDPKEMLFRPSASGAFKDDYVIFCRREGVYCVGTKKMQQEEMKEAVELLRKCCVSDLTLLPSNLQRECGVI